MQSAPKPETALDLYGDAVFLPVVTSCVEKSARAFGMDDTGSLSLTLAAEEIFSYLCRFVVPHRPVRIVCRTGGYYVDVEFLFPARDFDMRAFNITACLSTDDETCLEETGLLIASRMVDRFKFSEHDNFLRLLLTKERDYPDPFSDAPPLPSALEEFVVRVPDAEEIKAVVGLIMAGEESYGIPHGLRSPGRLVDMVASGDYQVAVAADRASHIGGAIAWHREGTGMVECYGPYVFNQRSETEMARTLMDHCLGAIARQDVRGLINRHPTPHLPREYFEELGSAFQCGTDCVPVELAAYYRQLEEDPGSTVWSHPDLKDFLEDQYRRLILPREIKDSQYAGEESSPFSVLSAEFYRTRQRVTLRPVWWGTDSEKTVGEHVKTLTKEGISFIFFEMDLGRAWHCHFTPSLLNNGFEPRFVLPYAGRGDLVVFQCMRGASFS